MHHHAAIDWVYWMNWVANLVIVAGYFLVPFTVLRYLPLTRSVRTSGTVFFATCATTHAAMAFGFVDHPIMLANHVVQAAAVVWFVTGFWMLLRDASQRRQAGGGDPR